MLIITIDELYKHMGIDLSDVVYIDDAEFPFYKGEDAIFPVSMPLVNYLEEGRKVAACHQEVIRINLIVSDGRIFSENLHDQVKGNIVMKLSIKNLAKIKRNYSLVIPPSGRLAIFLQNKVCERKRADNTEATGQLRSILFLLE